MTAILCSVCFLAAEFAFDLVATLQPNGTRAAVVTVNGHRSCLPDGSSGVRDAAATPDGRYVLFTHGLGRYHLPATQLDHGWISTSAVSVFDAATGKRVNTFLLDDPSRGAANPWGIAISERWIAIALAGTHEISIVSTPRFLQAVKDYPGDASGDLGFMQKVGRKRIQLCGQGPRQVRFRKDGKLEVRLHFSECTAVVDPESGKADEPSAPGGLSSAVLADPVRRGEAYFNDATLCYQMWQSCASCHPDGTTDGLLWDFPFSGGGLGHPEKTPDLSRLREYRRRDNDYHINLYSAPQAMLNDTEAYIRRLIDGMSSRIGAEPQRR